MRRLLESLFHRAEPYFAAGKPLERLHPLLEAVETFALTPAKTTTQGAHVRDPLDMKRLMMFVVFAILPCMVVGMWSIGHQAYLAEGLAEPPLTSCFLRGAWHMLPIVITSYAVGGAWEVLFAVVRRHEINEGFLVTGMLFPLTLAPTTPLWVVAMGISFGVVIGKEVFGGVGMNILNPALAGRAFVFFAYPATISGGGIWTVAGRNNPLASRYADAPVDGWSGATPLLEVTTSPRGSDAVEVLNAAGWSFNDLALGIEPGSMGEVSAIAAIVGALFLIVTGVGSWRIIGGCFAGLAGMAALTNLMAGPDSLTTMTLPAHYHLVMGGFAFGMAYMATDPVSGASTLAGQWVYGLCIGALTVVIRVFNPAYPEGMMLAILFMNVFAPLIDYVVVRGTTRARAKRMAAT